MSEGVVIQSSLIYPVAIDTQLINKFSTTTTSTITAGASSFVVSSLGSIVSGDILIVDTGNIQEFVSVYTTNTGTSSVYTNQTFRYNHNSSVTVLKSYTQQIVSISDSYKRTYIGNITNLSASTGIVFTLIGSSSVKTKLRRVIISGLNSSSNILASVKITKRNPVTAGATTSGTTLLASDSTDSANNATIAAYAATPTAGTLLGVISAVRMFFPTSGSSAPQIYEKTWDSELSKPPTLNSNNEILCVELDTAISNLDITFAWTEE